MKEHHVNATIDVKPNSNGKYVAVSCIEMQSGDLIRPGTRIDVPDADVFFLRGHGAIRLADAKARRRSPPRK